MKTLFSPIMFGECSRYRAICMGDHWFVADAETRDYQNKERATITNIGLISSLPSVVGLVSAISGELEYSFDNRIGWMEEYTELELINLYEAYINELYGIVASFDSFEYL